MIKNYYDTQLSIEYFSFILLFICILLLLFLLYSFTRHDKSFPCDCIECKKLKESNWKKPLNIKRTLLVCFSYILFDLININKIQKEKRIKEY